MGFLATALYWLSSWIGNNAIAVAAFGQKLRGDPWLGDGFDWEAVLEQAQGARGEDPSRERAEFVQMVRAAQALPARAVP